jgi:ABC-type Fe3+/spermidine/putrescine transport system ATPase subunit
VSRLEIRSVEKSFGDVRVLKGVDLDVESGEFFTLLGPSGCGKTTLLRIIAGFQGQDAGEVHVDGDRIDRLPAHKRDVGMVFQDYAVFPHLTVAENVAFGLRARRLPEAEIRTRVEEGLRMVRLDGLAGRLPSELSGGQQQRVGLARAMAIRPRLLLMDEPLSNLDAKLRIDLREDIRDIQRRLGITTIYVTHDQEEALAISDRICVMEKGIAEQVGSPFDVYHAPRRRFSAAFVGTMNFLPATRDGARVRVGSQVLPLAAPSQDGFELAIRPENVLIGPRAEGRPGVDFEAVVGKVVFLGREAQYTLRTEAGDLLAQVADPTRELLAVEGRPMRLRLPYDKLFVCAASGDVSRAQVSA